MAGTEAEDYLKMKNSALEFAPFSYFEYFRFQAFARAHRTWKDAAAVVNIDGPFDRITIVAEPIAGP